MNDFSDVQVFTGRELMSSPQSGQVTAAASIEQSRAVAEVQAAMLVARMNPRDETMAYQRIMQACKRKSFADQAMYAYPRGGKVVTGPSIRMAEVCARAWGNMTYGLREISRTQGESEIEAFAWDLESNTRVTRGFKVRHIRDRSDSKGGNAQLTGERDIYELVANMGQRRVRACILEIIPGDIVEAAEDQCKKTIEKGEKPIEDRIRDMVVAFTEFGVSKDMIEAFLGHKLEATIGPELVRLTQVYRSLKDGMAKREDFFSISLAPAESTEPPKTTRKHKESKPPVVAEQKEVAIPPAGCPYEPDGEVRREKCETEDCMAHCEAWGNEGKE
jgi:hypothetical protein